MKEYTANKPSEVGTWLLVAIIIIGIGYWAAQVKIIPQPTSTVATDIETSSTNIQQPTSPTKPSPTTSSSTSLALKQKCASYRATIEGKMGVKNIGGITIANTLDEIFYSPVADSCLYSFITVSGVSTFTAFYTINDYLSNTKLFGNVWEPPMVEDASGKLIHPYPTEPNPSYYQFVAEKNRLKGK